MFSKKTRDGVVDYSLESIKYICEEIGPREPGLPNERKAQEWLKKEVLDNQWADTAVIDDFTVSRHALVGFSKIAAVLMMIAIASGFLSFAGGAIAMVGISISLLLSLFTLFMTIMEFVLYKPFIDPLFPKSTSCNMYATLKPKGEVKRRIIFSGHVDSAYEWTLMKKNVKFMPGVLVPAILGLVYSIIIYIVGLVMGGIPTWALIVSLVFLPVYILLLFLFNFKVVVPGANDNLTGTLAAISILKALKDEGIELENTEVGVVCTGSEEAGLRGATAWARKYGDAVKAESFETLFIALETFRDYEHMAIYHKDMSGTVKNGVEAVALLDKACAALGHNIPHKSVFFGASDAAAISKEGLNATCLAGMDPAPASYYHNMRDDADNMDRRSFELGMDIALKALEIYDAE